MRWALRREPRAAVGDQPPQISQPGMPEAVLAGGNFVATGLVCWLATGALIPMLRRRDVLDRPNERSSHLVPTPRGGGIAVIGAVLLAWLVLGQRGLGRLAA